MAEMFDRNDIKCGDHDPCEGGNLILIKRDGRDRYFVYDIRTDAYVETECRIVEVELTTD